MLEISGLPEEDPENEKLTRIVDRQLNGCTTLVKRQLKQCQVSVLKCVSVIALSELIFSFLNKNTNHLFPISRKIAQPEQVVIVVELILLMRL